MDYRVYVDIEEGLTVPSFRLMLLLPLALAAVLLPSAARSAAKVATPLTVTVGPGFTIKVLDANNNSVRQLDAGDYTFTVKNVSPAQEHNFHLSGPGGVNMASPFSNATVTWNVTLVNGTYNWKCDAHPTIMKGSIHVGPLPPAPKKLNGKVGPKLTISLKTASGAAVKTLKAGAYRIAVRDATKKDNFHLLGPGVNRKTGVKFRGAASWTVKLKVGKYTARSDAHKKLRRTFTVTPAT
jgi:plastocyanin